MRADKPQDEMNASVRHGNLIMIVALASIFVWLIISDGYNQNVGPAANFYYSMTVHQSEWSCKDIKYGFVIIDGKSSYSTSRVCTEITIYTKYMVLLSILAATYGFLIIKGILSDPFPRVAGWIQRNQTKLP